MSKSITSKLKSVAADKSVGKSSQPPHLIVAALAGTGKTTTLVEGLRYLRGEQPTITPSPQQAEIWKALAESPAESSVCFVAFNKSIATELQRRVPEGCNAMTMHSLGFRAVQKQFGRVGLSDSRVEDLLCKVTGKDRDQLMRESWDLIRNVEQMVGLCKMNLITSTDDELIQDLDDLAAHHQIELNGTRTRVYELVPKVLEACKDVDADRVIDFNDMIWLPVALGLSIQKYDLLLVDEVQDLNKCQQELAKMAGTRLVLCGDRHQAIYGFAGADSQSMKNMEDELRETERGCKVLPLTVTRRCSSAVVAMANKIVSGFEAHENNLPGSVTSWGYENGGFRDVIEDDAMVICRVNAPLISECFKLLKMGRKANIVGRDIGKGLTSLIKKLKPESLPDLNMKLGRWYNKARDAELLRKKSRESVLIALDDKYECLMCFVDECESVDDLYAKIQNVFSDDTKPGIRLSSIHKSKGLEAKSVWLIEPKGATVPHPMARSAWEKEQEWNLRYVAITRSLDKLHLVG